MQSGAPADNPNAFTAEESREVLYLRQIMKIPSVQRCMFPALAAYASAMAFDYDEVQDYFKKLLEDLESGIKLNADGSVKVIPPLTNSAAAPQQ